ncbi:MAG TPA: hypothetical protein VLK89_01520 [Solirubrobacterales bacterium]|nr:hypothetical protein [Solirubrobacterales bacterium]
MKETMDDIRHPADDDAAIEAVVLCQLLAIHPGQLTLGELVREIATAADDFGQRDAIERAVRDLDAVGLLHRNGELILPSRAARRFDELLG